MSPMSSSSSPYAALPTSVRGARQLPATATLASPTVGLTTRRLPPADSLFYWTNTTNSASRLSDFSTAPETFVQEHAHFQQDITANSERLDEPDLVRGSQILTTAVKTQHRVIPPVLIKWGPGACTGLLIIDVLLTRVRSESELALLGAPHCLAKQP